MSALVFMDTETTGLSLDDDIWEFAAIRRDEGGTERELHLFVEHDSEKCCRLPESFRVDHEARYDKSRAVSQEEAAELIGAFFRKSDDGSRAHVVGAVPNFDTERIGRLLARFGYADPWHYHLIDVENLAVGYLFGQYRNHPFTAERSKKLPAIVALPWDSDRLSEQVGVTPPTDDRHTAMGDVRWAMALYDHITGADSVAERVS